MKKCSVFLFLLVTLAAVGQKEYRIEGKVRNAAGNTVVQLLVWAGNMGKVIGSDTLKDEVFISGKAGRGAVTDVGFC